MIVLSLFDGMSATQQALKELGVVVDRYYASEIDKYAIQITQKPENLLINRLVMYSNLENLNHHLSYNM